MQDVRLETLSMVQFKNHDQSEFTFSSKLNAMVGPNGSGKTTLAKLLLGLYQPTAGNIRFDGLNHQQIHPSDLRRNIGYLPQDITLFHGTIRDNILFGTRQVTEYQLIRAVQLSGVNAFTDQETQGLDQQVGENGSTLSRGQRQSIALARAILNTPQILPDSLGRLAKWALFSNSPSCSIKLSSCLKALMVWLERVIKPASLATGEIARPVNITAAIIPPMEIRLSDTR